MVHSRIIVGEMDARKINQGQGREVGTWRRQIKKVISDLGHTKGLSQTTRMAQQRWH